MGVQYLWFVLATVLMIIILICTLNTMTAFTQHLLLFVVHKLRLSSALTSEGFRTRAMKTPVIMPGVLDIQPLSRKRHTVTEKLLWLHRGR